MTRSSWRRHLPDFDPISKIKRQQRETANALRMLGLDHLPMRECSGVEPCRNGLCARCARQLRSHLLGFLADEYLDQQHWHFVTIRPEGWTMPAGEFRQFGLLRDHPLVENLVKRFRRMVIPGLIIFGSVETVYNTVSNRPAGKPFHIHLMVAAASAAQINGAVQAIVPLNGQDVKPLDIRRVGSTPEDFYEAASYAFKQPLLKKSRVAPASFGVMQSLKAAERRELIQNLGVHGWTRRLILSGIRCDSGRFRLTANLSATTNRGENPSSHQLLSGGLPQASRHNQLRGRRE
ncbi:hypothetical protein PV773_13265 [Mesorhizobium sp. CC13]|uniref:hypothetical protein n=1 Tax=Mesorhizobium sp. CC13 TaxID=3029194 RepID=UPI003267E7C9